jgi:viroplasmin and RNaseH domain-containing protein
MKHVISAHIQKHSLNSKSNMPGNDCQATYEIRKEIDITSSTKIQNSRVVKSAIMLSDDVNISM